MKTVLLSFFLLCCTRIAAQDEPPADTAEREEEEVVVTATRTSRTITSTPTRVEVISGEELSEKANMKPGDIRMLLGESTGIQTQQTSATSYNYSIRIQGLDGRYTQLLRDGYPLYGGFSGGLSLLQIAPLDLRQVEVIKGAASTLYGGGAIAGLVNLVSKTPATVEETLFLANGTTAGGLDLSGFLSRRLGKAGVTLFLSRNSSAPYDPSGIGLTAIPEFGRYTVHPRFFYFGGRTTADAGVSWVSEGRTGGSTAFIKGRDASGYFEANDTRRLTTQAGLQHRLSERSTLHVKNSYTRFRRDIQVPDYRFDALQQSSFTELSLDHLRARSEWVVGANFLTDDLREMSRTADGLRDYHYNTAGVFAQHTWSASERLKLESGLRGDWTEAYGFELLPRLSLLFRIAPDLTTRIGGGSGYKLPTPFTEEAERRQFRGIQPLREALLSSERSIGGNWDLNWFTAIGPVQIALNHLFFYTRLRRPLILQPYGSGAVFSNAEGYIDTRGTETNLRLLFGDFKLFVGYTFTDAATHFGGGAMPLQLTARHRLNNVLMWEMEERWKLGLEGYYFGRQPLSDGTSGRPYWITGFMAERLWEKASLFLNFENFTDTKQTDFGPLYEGTIANPVFRDIYAPLEGFVVNGGLRLRLF